MPVSWHRAVLIGLGMLVATTCDSPTQPITHPSVTLAELRISDFAVLRDSGLLVVIGIPEDTTRVLGPSERLRIAVTTSGGDNETFDLSPIICDGLFMSCNGVGLVMQSGHQVGELFSVLNSVPARTYLVVFGGEGAGVFVFDPAKVDGAVRQLKSQPGVKSAERDGFAAFPPPRRFGTRGGLPLDFRPVAAHDGVLQAQPGDTVTVRYTQPDGSVLELPTIIPPPPTPLPDTF